MFAASYRAATARERLLPTPFSNGQGKQTAFSAADRNSLAKMAGEIGKAVKGDQLA
jgi:hypothetical protein